MISGASLKYSIERTNNDTIDEDIVCATVPDNCFFGNCTGGTCARCAHNPLRCCAYTPGDCISAAGVYYGVCAPACGWYGR